MQMVNRELGMAKSIMGMLRYEPTHSKFKGGAHVENLTSCSKSANKLCSHCLSQVVNKFGTNC